MVERCNFCKKDRSQVNTIIQGYNDTYICDQCIELSHVLISKESFKKLKKPYPTDIKDFLDEYVIGQERAKRVLSIAAYNHYKRITSGIFDKTNILMLGPTGSGKTLLAKTLAKALNVPFIIADATSLTETGYVGDDVENVITRLYNEANYDLDKTESGIIYLDEIDKIAKKSEGHGIVRDISGEGVQQALLKLAEGTVISITHKNHKQESRTINIDTSNILFIAGGAFVGIDQIIQNRISAKSGFGFNSKINEDSQLEKLEPNDIKEFGFIPEFIGRFPTITILDPLEVEDIYRIFSEPKHNILSQYKNMFELDGIELEVTDGAQMEIAKRCMELNTNARGLRSVLEDILEEHQFNIGNYVKSGVTSVTVNEDLTVTIL